MRCTRVAADVGATTTELTADDVVTAIVDLATQHQITQLVLSAPPPARFAGLRRSSKLVRLLPLAAANGSTCTCIAAAASSEGGRLDAASGRAERPFPQLSSVSSTSIGPVRSWIVPRTRRGAIPTSW